MSVVSNTSKDLDDRYDFVADEVGADDRFEVIKQEFEVVKKEFEVVKGIPDWQGGSKKSGDR